MAGGSAVGLTDAQGRNGSVRRRDGAWHETLVNGNGAYTTTTQLAKLQALCRTSTASKRDRPPPTHGRFVQLAEAAAPVLG
jgi:hypothetical protein